MKIWIVLETINSNDTDAVAAIPETATEEEIKGRVLEIIDNTAGPDPEDRDFAMAEAEARWQKFEYNEKECTEPGFITSFSDDNTEWQYDIFLLDVK